MFSFTISDQSSDVSNMVSQTTISPQVSQDPGRKTSSRRRSEDNPEMMRHRVFVNRAHMQLTLDLMSSLMIDNFLPEKKLLETFAFSPLSLQSTLMMMHLGSRGITRKEISDALYLSRMTDYLRSTLTDDNSTNLSVTKAHEIYGDSVMSLLNDVSLNKILRIANQMFVQRDLIPNSSFENMLKQYHSSRLKPVDFTTNPRTLINDWISKESDELINEFLSAPPSPTSLLMAINVVTFQGEWVYRFNSMDTEHDARFRRTNGELSRISMMVGKLPVAYTYNEQLNTTVIELPYKTARLGLFLLLPDEATGELLFSSRNSVF
jgi:serine protease inhibitor